MGIKEFANEAKRRGIKLTPSEKEELDGKVNELYEKFRELGVYRIYDTYYTTKPGYTDFYCTGFINDEIGYEYLLGTDDISVSADNLENVILELYVQLDMPEQKHRSEKHLMSGTIEEVLAYSKKFDKQPSAIYKRHRQK